MGPNNSVELGGAGGLGPAQRLQSGVHIVTPTKKRLFAQANPGKDGSPYKLYRSTSSDENGGVRDLAAGRTGNVIKIDPKKYREGTIILHH
jgi:hypothetical protein